MSIEERRIVMLAVAGFALEKDELAAIRPLYMRLFVDSGGQVKPGVEVRPATFDINCPHVELFARHGGSYAPVSCPYCKPPSSPQETVLAQVAAERTRQDRQWGGESHDDEHSPKDWLKYIADHRDRAVKVQKDPDDYRHRLVVIAALAVAAVEAHDRSRK